MRNRLSALKQITLLVIGFLFLNIPTNLATAQTYDGPPVKQLSIKNFAIFGGDNNASLVDSTLSGVEFASNISVQGGGAVGSYTFVQMVNQVNIQGDLYGNTIRVRSTTSVKGNTFVRNVQNRTYNVLEVNGIGDFTDPGNIVVNGNSFIASGVVNGSVQHSENFTYTGPAPGGGEDLSTPVFPALPQMPFISEFSASGPNISSSQTIKPGTYGIISLSNNQTLTFSGVGAYYIDSIKNTGANNFVFDFQNNSTGAIQLFIRRNANVGNINVTLINGGSASRIYTEAQGVGKLNTDAAFTMNTQNQTSANWEGTVWAPYGNISIGETVNGSINVINGCLWSAHKVRIGINTAMKYVPLSTSAETRPNTLVLPYYPPPADGKITTLIGSELTSLFENRTAIGNDSIIYRVFGDKVVIEVIAIQGKYAEALSFLQTNGLTNLINNGPRSLVITGRFPINNLLLLNTRPDLIDYVRPQYWPIRNSGIVETQGDTAMQSHFVRGGYNLTGNGVKIGVLSDSYNTIPGDYAGIDIRNGDLPGVGNPQSRLSPVNVIGEYPYGQSIDEGRAMLQIIHDVAPDAQLAFRTGFVSAGDFAQGITQLKEAGCKVIVDDITYITEPYFTDGVVANAVDLAVGDGVTYFSAAGNFGKKSYEGTFDGIPAPAGLRTITSLVHDFSTSGTGNPFQTLNLAPGNYTIVLQWEDAVYSLGSSTSGTQTDLDIYLVDNSGTALFGFNRNNIGADPIEVLPFTVTTNTSARLLISKAGTGPGVRFKYIVFRGNLTIEGYAGSSTLVGQANASGAIAVGAVLYSNTPPYGVAPPTIASFSSMGGARVNGTVRTKPELTAPNGVHTTVDFNSFDIDDPAFPNFYGTSAAAPHAAAAAALLIQGQQRYLARTITPAEIRSLLTATAYRMAAGTPDGYNPVSGYGLVQPFAAMQTFASPKPEIVGIQLPSTVSRPVSAAFTLVVKGRFLTSQTKIYFRDVALNTTFDPANPTEVSATIDETFSDDPVIRLYNPPITSRNDGGFSESLHLFSTGKKLVIIKAENKAKKYGERLPAFTAKITVDGVAVSSGMAASLQLNNLQFTTPATSSSNVGSYFIQPLNPIGADNPLLNEYTYQFDNGILSISKLPLQIKPRDTVLTYGNRIKGIRYNYVLGPSTTLQNPDSIVQTLNTTYVSSIIDSVYALLNGSGATSRALVNSDFENLSILISNGSGATSRALVNHGSGATETSYVINVDTPAMVNYFNDPATAPLGNGSGATSRALVNTGPLVNGTASVTLGNGSGATSRALVNGDPALLNSSTAGGTNITNIAVIISEADLDSTTGIKTKSVNMVTGIMSGVKAIIPGAFLSGNYIVTYKPGKLTINKAALNVTASTLFTNNGIVPLPYTSTINYQYQDASLATTNVSYAGVPSSPAAPGVYTITPMGLTLSDYSNYTGPNYIPGTLYVNPYGTLARKITLQLKCVEPLTGDPNYKYIAHFTYENKNTVPVYVPLSADNKITSNQPFSGVPPVVFLPGINKVSFKFNGQRLTWSVKTNDGTSKKSVSEISANASSPKCKALTNNISNSLTTTVLDDENAPAGASLFPNPATTRLWITYKGMGISKSLSVVDAEGRTFEVKVVQRTGQQTVLDVSGLQKGVYFIRISSGNDMKTMPFIKL